jgi:glycosyltransferase involved in cell wall biosynthesis
MVEVRGNFMLPKVSVIVPVYNTEKYLKQCLRSLVAQTLSEIEIIVVNDQSPDNSQDIIDYFARMYPQKVVSLKKENEGLEYARNFGLKRAREKFTVLWIQMTG